MTALMTIHVEGSQMVARSPISGIELARTSVKNETTVAHVQAGYELLYGAFRSLSAEGFQRATKGTE